MQRRQAKANLYVSQLDRARCDADWFELPEAIRKVRKHAPHRQCLAVTAHSEHQLTLYLSKILRNSSVESSSSLNQLIPPLSAAVEAEKLHTEDSLQGLVCLAWLHRTLGKPDLVLARLPDQIIRQWGHLAGVVAHPVEWTRVCVVKAVYFQGASQWELGRAAEAMATLATALPLIAQYPYYSTCPELQKWAERLLIEGCLLSDEIASQSPSRALVTDLSFFRAWARFWEEGSGHGLVALGGYSAKAGLPRRSVWAAYFRSLSILLQAGWPDEGSLIATSMPSPDMMLRDDPADMPLPLTKSQKRAELQRTQSTYEALLLKEVRFPKANQNNGEVGEWVEHVMGNWTVFSGSDWQDEDLGEGGKEGVGRGVLDVLYRAATKSFHSTPILRHLFAVHASLGEFQLAFKAFDTYLEIVKKGRARVDKSGKEEPDLDKDEIVLRTASSGVRALCAYGHREDAERAQGVGRLMEDWLRRHMPDRLAAGDGATHQGNGVATPATDRVAIAPAATADAHRAIGISLAQWASLTYDATARPEIQTEALQQLRRALLPELEDPDNVESLFAVSLLLAQKRDLTGAVEVVKKALLPQAASASTNASGDAWDSAAMRGERPGYERERKLLPLWHLLSLILSARQDFVSAAKSCEAALEQFPDFGVLFGPDPSDAASIAASTNEKVGGMVSKGLVDRMGLHEKACLIQIKMTQLALIEVLEGPESAVNACDELLTWYGRLFGNPMGKPAGRPAAPPPEQRRPKSSAGTIRSIRSTILGGSKSKRKSARQSTLINFSSMGAESRASPMPAIHVTDEGNDAGALEKLAHEHEFTSPHRPKLQKRNSLIRAKSVASLRRKRQTNTSQYTLDDVMGVEATNGNGHAAGDEIRSRPRSLRYSRLSITPSQVGIAVSADVPSAIPPLPTTTIPGQSGPPSSQNLPGKQTSLPYRPANASRPPDVRLAAGPSSTNLTHEPLFPPAHERRLRLGLLVDVWLLIAGLYRRAKMYEDAKGATDEASELVNGLASATGAAKSQDDAAEFAKDRPRGGGKRVEELWADIWAERGALARAQEMNVDALSHFEEAISRHPDHPAATVGLCEILLDVSTQKIHLGSAAGVATARPPAPGPEVAPSTQSSSRPPQPAALQPSQALDPPAFGISASTATAALAANLTTFHQTTNDAASTATPTAATTITTTATLDHLAARDRAHGLLSSLTKLGTGWDRSEAWFLLARSYEEGGQVEKAKEVLWWCVELEDARPVRDWGVVNPFWGYVL
ncbi:MAG: hypothetical protein M1838_005312 [Thelocarpon superellum]|nr:MAG: hypothetical protein M1838_005312 [Thelocarpon superellum]